MDKVKVHLTLTQEAIDAADRCSPSARKKGAWVSEAIMYYVTRDDTADDAGILERMESNQRDIVNRLDVIEDHLRSLPKC